MRLVTVFIPEGSKLPGLSIKIDRSRLLVITARIVGLMGEGSGRILSSLCNSSLPT